MLPTQPNGSPFSPSLESSETVAETCLAQELRGDGESLLSPVYPRAPSISSKEVPSWGVFRRLSTFLVLVFGAPGLGFQHLMYLFWGDVLIRTRLLSCYNLYLMC